MTALRTVDVAALMRDEWLAAKPLVRCYAHTIVGGRLPSLVRLLEGGRVVAEHRGATETDGLANLLQAMIAGAP